MKSRLVGAVCACVFLLGLVSTVQAAPVSGQGTWETTLQGRDLDGNPVTFEAYYDTVLDITWAADANINGWMNWADANAWAAGLDINGVTGWRLPNTAPVDGVAFDYNYTNWDGSTDHGYNVGAPGSIYEGSTGSEMAHMYYTTLGNLAPYDPATGDARLEWGLSNTGPFTGILEWYYWSATEYTPQPNNAYYVHFTSGHQYYLDKVNYDEFAWPVRAGDVGAPPLPSVPIPAAVWLFGSGLLGLLGVARNKSAAARRCGRES